MQDNQQIAKCDVQNIFRRNLPAFYVLFKFVVKSDVNFITIEVLSAIVISV